MATTENKLVKDFVDAIKSGTQEKTKAYETPATVTRIEDGTAWVHVPGGVEETPVQLTINATEGDTVRVRVANGRATIVGNVTNPPTDDATAKEALSNANSAIQSAKNASIAAASAESSAAAAKESATEAKRTTDEINAYADTAGKTVTQILHDGETAGTAAEQAKTDAASAKVSAENASEYAARALGNLSTVQSVTETLNWITAHGTMTLTEDTELDPTHVYFVADQNGDYVVGGNHYSVVTEPNVDDIATYYELGIDESLNNYVATHLSLTSEGLYVMADDSEWKVKIADDGVYILDPNNTPANQMTGDGNIIGYEDETHAEIDYHSLKLIAKDETDPYLYISDLRSKHTSEDEYGEGFYYVADDQFDGDGTEKEFELSLVASRTNYKVYLNSELVTSGITKYRDRAVFDTAPVGLIKVEYPSDSNNLKAYTLGHRDYNPSPGYYPKIGAMSVAEGIYIIASGRCTHAEGVQSSAIGEASHAEGYNTIARGTASHAEGGGPFSYKTEAKGTASHAEGWDVIAFADCSHAEGRSTEANGEASHAQNRGTIANRANQTTIGRYNDNKSDTALEIGNGTSDADRSNAFTVDWDGNVEIALDTTATSGTDKEIYDALVSLGWDSDVIV